MILVAMGQDDAEKPVPTGQNGFHRRNNQINPHLQFIGKHQTAINENSPFGRVPQLAVEADFPQSPEGGNGHLRRCCHVFAILSKESLLTLAEPALMHKP